MFTCWSSTPITPAGQAQHAWIPVERRTAISAGLGQLQGHQSPPVLGPISSNGFSFYIRNPCTPLSALATAVHSGQPECMCYTYAFARKHTHGCTEACVTA